MDQTNAKIENIEKQIETKEELKTVALGTSKINYLDPRITVAWCKRHEVPIEKVMPLLHCLMETCTSFHEFHLLLIIDLVHCGFLLILVSPADVQQVSSSKVCLGDGC